MPPGGHNNISIFHQDYRLMTVCYFFTGVMVVSPDPNTMPYLQNDFVLQNAADIFTDEDLSTCNSITNQGAAWMNLILLDDHYNITLTFAGKHFHCTDINTAYLMKCTTDTFQECTSVSGSECIFVCLFRDGPVRNLYTQILKRHSRMELCEISVV